MKYTMPAWFKLLLAWLVLLLLLLVWLGSMENESPQTSAQHPATKQPTHAPQATHTAPTVAKTKKPSPKPALDSIEHDEIMQVLQPLLQEKTATLTFEDALPEPVPAYNKPTKHDKYPQRKTAAQHHSKQLALLIDDVGYDLHALQRLIALPFNISVAILPDAPHAQEAAQMAFQHGVKVMLHMPMQTSNPKYQQKMERYYLHNHMSKAQFNKVFEAALAKVPHVEGINNHMGSLLTSNRKYMQWLMALCQKHGLFFIDSRTAASSVAADIAAQAHIPWNKRDIFLDHKVDAPSLQHAWDSAIACLEKNKQCIIIAHPHRETLNFLERHARGINKQTFVAIDSFLHH